MTSMGRTNCGEHKLIISTNVLLDFYQFHRISCFYSHRDEFPTFLHSQGSQDIQIPAINSNVLYHLIYHKKVLHHAMQSLQPTESIQANTVREIAWEVAVAKKNYLLSSNKVLLAYLRPNQRV